MISAIGIEFKYQPEECQASDFQITRLLEGFAYSHIRHVHDDDDETITVSGLKFCGKGWPLNELDHEVVALSKIMGDCIPVEYYRLSDTERCVYNEVGECYYRKP